MNHRSSGKLILRLGVLCLLLVGGCGGTSRKAAPGKSYPPRPRHHPIVIYESAEEIERPYEVVGSVEGKKRSINPLSVVDPRVLYPHLQNQARRLGADAILIGQKESGRRAAYVTAKALRFRDTHGGSVVVPQDAPTEVQAAYESVVIVVTGERTGTGFVVGRNRRVVTSEQIIRGATRIQVRTADGKELPATVSRRAPDGVDAVLLQVDLGTVPALAIGDPGRLDTGDRVTVAAAGAPLLRVALSGVRPGRHARILEIEAKLEPGMRGGPVLNDEGEVVGVVTEGAGAALDIYDVLDALGVSED